MILQFKRALRDLVLDGRKTQSLRANRPGGQVGDSITLMNGYRPGAKFATAVCSRVEPVAIADLTEEIARADGFPDLATLLELLAKTYPAASSFWLVAWTTVTPFRKETP